MSVPTLVHLGSCQHPRHSGGAGPHLITMTDFVPIVNAPIILTHCEAVPMAMGWWYVGGDYSLSRLESLVPLVLGQGVGLLEAIYWPNPLFFGLMTYKPDSNMLSIIRLDPQNRTGVIQQQLEIGGGAGSGTTFNDVTSILWSPGKDEEHPLWKDPGVWFLFRNTDDPSDDRAELHLFTFTYFGPRHAWELKLNGLPPGGCVRWMRVLPNESTHPALVATDGRVVHLFEPAYDSGEDHASCVENYVACECNLGPQVFVVGRPVEVDIEPSSGTTDHIQTSVLSYDPESGLVLSANLYRRLAQNLPDGWNLKAKAAEATRWPKHCQIRLSPNGDLYRYNWDRQYFDFFKVS
jgi:hypothetical protein